MILIGYPAFLDPPKVDAAEAIRQLCDEQVVVKVLTGDNERSSPLSATKWVSMRHILCWILIRTHLPVRDLHDVPKPLSCLPSSRPLQKARVIRVLRENGGHTVGFGRRH